MSGVFNPDQSDHMRWLASLSPEEKCACGWESLENCLRGHRMPACTMVEVEVTTNPDAVLVHEWQAARTLVEPWTFLGWTKRQYERWTQDGVIPVYEPEDPVSNNDPNQPPPSGRPVLSEVLDLLRGVGIQPTLNGKPIGPEDLREEVLQRAESKVRDGIRTLADRLLPPRDPPQGGGGSHR